MRNIMLRIEFAALLLGQVLMLAGCDDAKAPVTDASQPSSSGLAVEEPSTGPVDVSSFEAALRKEPKIIDFVYDPNAAFQWTIGVKDDGSPRYGYADYLCQRIGEEGLPVANTIVRIVDYAKFMEPGGNGRDASLGSVRCSDGQRIMTLEDAIAMLSAEATPPDLR